MDQYSLTIDELDLRITIIETDIKAAQEEYAEALSKDLVNQELNRLKEKISFLKRKHSLFSQAKQKRNTHFL